MVELSVGLPMFKSKRIAWLAMEGLCRQENAPPWELIACEELYAENETQYCGRPFLETYAERLVAAGCINIKPITGTSYIYLEQKWKMIHAAMGPSSRILLLQGSDDYSAKDRLARTWATFKEKDFDWYSTGAYFLDILKEKAAKFRPTFGNGTFIAVRKELLDKLPDSRRGRSADYFLKTHAARVATGDTLPPKEFRDILDRDYLAGVCTDGFNRISKDRTQFYNGSHPEFDPAGLGMLNFILPKDIVKRLEELRKDYA